MFDGIIFDVDGTLWNACDQVIDAWSEEAFRITGKPIPAGRDELRGMFGKTMDEIYRAVFPDYPEEEQERYGKAIFDYEIAYLKEHPGTVYEGIPEMLRELKKDYPLFIVSNCQAGYIEIVLESGGIQDCIADYMCFDDTKSPKSFTIQAVMKRNGLKNVLYIGDTQGDADACRDAGVPFLFVEYGLGKVSNEYPRTASVQGIPRAIRELERD